MAKHGNWNARLSYRPHGDEREAREKQQAATFAVASRLFEVVNDSELSSSQQDCAVALFNALWARRKE